MIKKSEKYNRAKHIEEHISTANRKQTDTRIANSKMSASATATVFVANPEEKKAVKPPSKRKIFYDEMRGKIQAQFPGLKLAQTNQKLFELWKIHLDEEFAFKPMGLYK